MVTQGHRVVYPDTGLTPLENETNWNEFFTPCRANNINYL